MSFSSLPSRRGAQDEEDSDDGDEEVEDEDEDEDEEEDEEGEGGVAGPELSRAERRELKKKQAAKEGKRGEGADDGHDDDGGEDEDEDELIANPNRVTKKLNISDLSAPRELTRRERYVSVPLSHAPARFFFFPCPFVLTILPLLCVGNRRRRRRPRTGIGRYSNAG
jgi:hypothetical protein